MDPDKDYTHPDMEKELGLPKNLCIVERSVFKNYKKLYEEMSRRLSSIMRFAFNAPPLKMKGTMSMEGDVNNLLLNYCRGQNLPDRKKLKKELKHGRN